MSESQSTNALAALNPATIKNALRSDRGLVEYLDQVPMRLTIAKQSYPKIQSDEQAQSASELLNWFKAGRDRVFKACEPITKMMNALHKTATSERADMSRDFEAGVTFLEGRIKEYIREQEAEKRRLQAEMDAQVEAEKRRMQAEADKLVQRGQVKEADRLQMAAQTMMAPPLPPAKPELSGTAYRGKWVASVDDIMAFAKAIVEGKIPLMHMYRGEQRPLLMFDNAILQQEAARMGKALGWPGVRVEEDFSLSRKGDR